MKERFIEKLKAKLCELLFPIYVENFRINKRISDCRLNHLRNLIHLCYLYESKKEIFYRKFRESITLEELKKNYIIDFTHTPAQIAKYILYDNVLSGKKNIDYDPTEMNEKKLIKCISSSLSPEEMEMISLLASGFTPKELNVIFGMKQHMSMAVKIHRIRKKCMGQASLTKQTQSIHQNNAPAPQCQNHS